MFEFQKKKKIRKVIYSPLTLLFLIIVFFLALHGVWGVYKKEGLSSRNLEKEKMELEKIIIRERSLRASIDYLNTPQGIENEIRTKFRAVKEGERIAVIIDEGTGIIKTITVPTTTQSFWYKLFH